MRVELERRKPDMLDKLSKLFESIVPILVVISALVALTITISKVDPLCNLVENEIRPQLENMKIELATYKERVANIDKNVIEIKRILERGAN